MPRARHGVLRGCLGTAVAIAGIVVLSSCGAADSAAYEQQAEQLRALARQVADHAHTSLSGDATASPDQVRTAIEKQIPPLPWGRMLSSTLPAGTDRADVGVALRGQVDGYGPGNITMTLRLCVLISMTPPPNSTTAISDIDCGSRAMPADSTVRYDG